MFRCIVPGDGVRSDERETPADCRTCGAALHFTGTCGDIKPPLFLDDVARTCGCGEELPEWTPDRWGD